MFGLIDQNRGLLFASIDLSQLLQQRARDMTLEIEGFSQDRILSSPAADLVDYLVDKYGLDPLRLLREDWYSEQKEIQIDVSQDPRRAIMDNGRPALVRGERIEVHVPFEGHRDQYSSLKHR
ncbi:MAG: hypothetical protein ACJ8G1_25305 [Vitreoscilla sp.]|jgi:hypothetical protein